MGQMVGAAVSSVSSVPSVSYLSFRGYTLFGKSSQGADGAADGVIGDTVLTPTKTVRVEVQIPRVVGVVQANRRRHVATNRVSLREAGTYD